MRKAYIILTHKNPEQVYRLLQKLNDGFSSFFIHIDKRANKENFNSLSEFFPNVHYVKREKGDWGSFGIVRATLNALEQIKTSDLKFEQIILLSGQDYPIKSNSCIDDFFKNSGSKIFIEYSTFPVARWNKGGMHRAEIYFFGTKLHQKIAGKFLNFLKRIFPALQKKKPYNYIPYGGSQWWCIDMSAMNYILKYVKDHPKYIAYYKYSLMPDESFFQTILLNAEDPQIKYFLKNDNKRLIIFLKNQASPKVWTKQDFDVIKNSDALFARKFDIEVDIEILNLIDKKILDIN